MSAHGSHLVGSDMFFFGRRPKIFCEAVLHIIQHGNLKMLVLFRKAPFIHFYICTQDCILMIKFKSPNMITCALALIIPKPKVHHGARMKRRLPKAKRQTAYDSRNPEVYVVFCGINHGHIAVDSSWMESAQCELQGTGCTRKEVPPCEFLASAALYRHCWVLFRT